MKKYARRGFAAVVGLLLALTACGTPEAEESGPPMGRYVEEVLPLPSEVVTLRHIGQQDDGTFLLIGQDSLGELTVWVSPDGGETWDTANPDWRDTLRRHNADAVTLDSAGRLWFTDAVPDPVLDEIYGSGDEDAIEAYIPPVNPLFAVLEGEAVEQPLSLQRKKNNAQSMVVSDIHLAASYGGSLSAYDLKSGEMVLTVERDSFLYPGDYLLDGETLVTARAGAIEVYSLESGALAAELLFQGEAVSFQKRDFFDWEAPRTILSGTPDDGVYAYCNSSGIYRVATDGLIHEKVVSGEMTSLSLPTIYPQRLFAARDAYYIYVTDGDSMPWRLSGAALLRYQYDETVPAFPSTELRVYALWDNPTVRQAIGVFQREHPEVRVRFDIALEESGSTTLDDARRALTTELLAGAGPDLLLLDGLPGESYREKGVLLDLADRLSSSTKEQIPSNILYHTGGETVYCVPARVTLPMILGTEEILEQVGDLHGLTACLEALASPQIGILPSDLFDLLYPVVSPQWYHSDGSVNEEALAQGLADMGEILARYDGMDTDRLWSTEGDARVGAIGWIDGWTPFYLHHLTTYQQLNGPYTAEIEAGGQYRPYPSPDRAVLLPQAVVGVSAASAQPELAVQFVECMLSETVQSLHMGDGLPVNRLAAMANQHNPSEGDTGNFGVSFHDEFAGGVEKGRTMPMRWPDEAYFQRIVQIVESARVDHLSGGSEKEIIFQEAAYYFRGEQPLTEAVEAVRRKLDLVQAE